MRLQAIYDIAEICSRKEIDEAVLCPGSRSAPVTLSFARHPKIQTRTISDERSAAFIALGIAQQKKKPVVLVCTSGSAAYNFAPAVAEAFYQRVPLVIITADRPKEWIGQWDGQTINQQSIYGTHVKKWYQINDDNHPDTFWSINRDVNEAINTCMQWPCGPVHLNISIREPLYPGNGEQIGFSSDVRLINPVEHKPHIPGKQIQFLQARLQEFKKILMVAGQQELSVNLIAAVHAFSSTYKCPVIAEIISNMHAVPARIVHTDSVLGAAPDNIKQLLQPDLLITFGKSVLSRNLKQFMRKYRPREHWHIEEGVDSVKDPFQSVTSAVTAHPEDVFNLLSKSVTPQSDSDYLTLWQDHDGRVASYIEKFFESHADGEFAFVNKALTWIPDHITLHLSNSMSVRYANLAGLPNTKKGLQVWANRGTSGIDGCTSTAFGHALMEDGIHVLLTGDMAFFYDRNAFWNNYRVPNLRIVIINNHGGAIFGMIDGPQGLPEADEYFITRQSLTARSLADEFGFGYTVVRGGSVSRDLLDAFFKPDGKTKILEYESTASDAGRIFLEFKEQMKKTYEA